MQPVHICLMTNMSMASCCVYAEGQPLNNLASYVLLDSKANRRMKVLCSASKGSRGFSPRSKKEKTNKVKAPTEETDVRAQARKSTSKPPGMKLNKAPGTISQLDGTSENSSMDSQFEERLEAVRSDNSNNETVVAENGLTEEEKLSLKTRLQQYEAKLSMSAKDPAALEGAAVTLSELGEYDRAASLLEKLSKEKSNDPEVYRLLGEVKYKLKDYEGSAAAYKSSASVNENTDFEVLRGLTNALLAAKKPDEAVQVLLDSRNRLNAGDSSRKDIQASSNPETDIQEIDPIQVELLLGKAYSDWGHVSDAVSVYDQLISMHSDDFRGYLAKGILLKAIGKVGDAERMFIQARFFAPTKAKALVDRYAKQ